MIWVMLCGFDQQYSDSKRREAAKSGAGRRTTQQGTGTGYSRQGGFDYDEHPFFDTGFGRCGMFGRSMQTNIDPGRTKAQGAEKVADDFSRLVLSFLAVLLPSPDSNTNFDVNPPEAVTSMLLESKVLNQAAELLRNDSLDNASKRKSLYDALLGLLRNIGTHKITSRKAMFSERLVRPDAVNLFTLSFQGGFSGTKQEPASPLADLLRNLNIQSNMMMKGAWKNRKEFDNQEGRDMLWLCRKISDLSEYLLGKDQAKTETAGSSVVEVPDDDICPTYHYTKDAQGLRQSPFGRIKRLITEITSLKTGLPPGIFVKHGTSRLDIMK